MKTSGMLIPLVATIAIAIAIFVNACLFVGSESERKMENTQTKKEMVVIETDKGEIVIELYPEAAPKTVENFRTLIDQNFYDGLTFHRHVPGFVIQGGCPEGTGSGGPGWTIPGEFQDENLRSKMPKHVKGVVAMARTQIPDSAGSQFYICLGTASHLDGSYTSFGRVIEGIEVVDQLRQGDVMRIVKLEERSE